MLLDRPLSRRFLILHGWQNHRPAGHWQRWLAEHLRNEGEQVLYPQLPDPDDPRLDAWLDVLRDELAMLGGGERIVITHSLGCLLWLRHAERAVPEEAVDRVLLVCPAGPAALPPDLAPFHAAPFDGAALRRSGRRVELVCTDADPWCPEGAAGFFGRALQVPVHVVPGGGHLSIGDGYGPWPDVAAWARDGVFPAGGSATDQRRAA
ncbi:MAG TPA: alpha/beta hydrolase [Baekduia sp.]|nr:alpha/beta hydrolase [Baekduia sp.]